MLIATVVFASMVFGAPALVQLPAREASGFSFAEGRSRPVTACAWEREEEFGTFTLRLVSDEGAGIRLQVTESLSLPLEEGVIPTFQTGLDAAYEEGELIFRKRVGGPVSEERLEFRLKIDPMLGRPEEGSARLWRKDELIRLPLTEIQRLNCRF